MPPVGDKVQVRKMVGGFWHVFFRHRLLRVYHTWAEAIEFAVSEDFWEFERKVQAKFDQLESRERVGG